MRRKISLYIGDQLVDLDDQSFILFNYSRDEASDPAIVKNAMSQQVTLPGSPKNNEIFGYFFRPDRVTDNGFNALVKTPFTIYNDLNEIIESGYLKLDKVNRKGGGICSYTITLFGGLGGFFYNLMYNDDGTKKSLADLTYMLDGHEIDPADYTMRLNRTQVALAWDVLAGNSTSDLYSLINYAPAYNGIPENFGSDRAVYLPGSSAASQIEGIYDTETKDGIPYSPHPNASGYILLQMEHNHTEWEVQDLRSYLQRPVINVLGLMQTIALAANTGDYTLVLDPYFFQSSTEWTGGAWMTLPMFDRANLNPLQFEMSDLLKGTDSPADYLIGFAKLFGLVFVYDNPTKTITLMQRDDYYQNEVIDLSRRLDTDLEIVPNAMDAKYYKWQYPEVFGQFAEEYRNKYGKDYGSQWVNTGYDFNADQLDVLEKIVYRGAPDVLESNGLFQVFGGQADSGTGVYSNYFFKFCLYEDVKWTLYGTNADGQQVTQDFSMTETPWISPLRYSLGTANYNDFMAKVQLHSADGKPDLGSNVLLFYEGMVATPYSETGGVTIQDVKFHLSDDTAAMLLLNEGVPCWDVSVTGSNILDVDELPQFRRWHFVNGSARKTFEIGVPQELAVSDVSSSTICLYNDFWDIYVSDRYDKDTKVVRVKVDFGGMQVSQELLRKFYWFDNSVWSLNRITNYSLTTYDPVECEFIQVQDKEHYMDGQE